MQKAIIKKQKAREEKIWIENNKHIHILNYPYYKIKRNLKKIVINMSKEKTCKEKGFNSDVFWKDKFTGKAKGGIYYRSFELNQFLRKLELEQNMNVIGLQFKENNLEIIVEENEKRN